MSLGKIKLKDLDAKKAKNAKASSRLMDYTRYPSGQAFMKAEEHPLYEFFQANFSCSEYVYLNNPYAKIKPKNLYSTNPLSIRKEFLEALKENIPHNEWSMLSRFFKDDISQCFVSYVTSFNEKRYNDPLDSGINLSRGSLGDFLRRTYWKIIVSEDKLSISELEIVKKYFMVITSDQLSLPPVVQKAIGPLSPKESKLLNEEELNVFTHPFYDFFREKFSLINAPRLIKPWHLEGKPNNFRTTYSVDFVQQEILNEINKNISLQALSPEAKKIILTNYSCHVSRVNQDRMSLEDDGINLSRGSLEEFLLLLQNKFLVEEPSLNSTDLSLIKEYFIFSWSGQKKVA